MKTPLPALVRAPEGLGAAPPPAGFSPRAWPHPIPKLLPPWRRNWNANRMGLS